VRLSLVTQQPLGGSKASSVASVSAGNGSVGWKPAGAATVLQEMLAVKSDDVVSRTKGVRKHCQGEPQSHRGHAGVVQRAVKIRSLGIDMELERS
jgi:DNA-directed RNA polymerase beta subunit